MWLMKLKSGPIPLYYQLETVFRNKIASGEWSVGSKIPNELELSKNYGVSVMTIKQALATLVTEGIISRKRGSGTFVHNISRRTISAGIAGSASISRPVEIFRTNPLMTFSK
jgi:GntR family transcriptional regulator